MNRKYTPTLEEWRILEQYAQKNSEKFGDFYERPIKCRHWDGEYDCYEIATNYESGNEWFCKKHYLERLYNSAYFVETHLKQPAKHEQKMFSM